MIVCKQFVFVHMPKTGGTFVRDLLKDHAIPAWGLRERAGHHPARRGPNGRPILGIVRNPWDWYVSSFFFRRHNYERHLGWWGRARSTWMPGMLEWAKLFDELPSGREGFNKALPIMTRMRGGSICAQRYSEVPSEDGRFSWRFDEFFRDKGGTLLCEIARFESLRADVEAFFQRHRIPSSVSFKHALRHGPKKNASPRGPYRKYYDDESRDLVARVDAALIEQYGYAF